MERTDWKRSESDGDEELDANGDYTEEVSVLYEAEEALDTVKGQVTQFPTAGLGIVNYLRKINSDTAVIKSPAKFKRDAKIELEADGHKNPEIIVSPDGDDFNFLLDTTTE